MKRLLTLTALTLAITPAFAQMSMDTNSQAETSSLAQGPGSGGIATGGNPTAAIITNTTVAPAPTDTTTHIDQHIKNVGTPGSMSLGISFSQYNCANSAGGGVGFMGGVIQIGGGMESDPCNARANASAFFQIAQIVAPLDPVLAKQLYHAAILLVGNSTKSTKEALQVAGVADWTQTPTPTQAPVPAPIINRVTAPIPEAVATSIATDGEDAETRPVPSSQVFVTALR